MKIALNMIHGGFGLSKEAEAMLPKDINYRDDEYRTDPRLIEVIEKLGEEANGEFARLAIFDIPEDATDYQIWEYDGAETLIYVVDGKIYEY